jgi:hypothetical protein
MVQGSADGARDMRITFYNLDSAKAPRLHVEYTAGGGASSILLPMMHYHGG